MNTSAKADHIETCKAHWPAFVIGSHRSGTTVLRYLLDAHENIACPPESKFFAALQDALDYPQAFAALRGLGLTRGDIHMRVGAFANSILLEYAVKKGKRRWVDKTPNYFRIMPFLDELFSARVLYVVIVRHPLDCIDSLNNYFYLSATHDDPDIARIVSQYGKGRYACARFWNEVYERVYMFQQSCLDRVHVLKYETLVAKTEVTMGAVFNFLGELHSDGCSLRALTQKRDMGFGDRKILQTREVHTRSIDKWQQWPAEEIDALWSIVSLQAERFGYRPPSSR